jgi:hypothetical protein
MQYQQQDLWCWAASSVSVNRFFSPGSGWKQCDVANQALNQKTCCLDGTGACNQAWYLEDALRIVGNLVSFLAHRAAESEVRTEIDTIRPLCLRIAWSTGGGHFVAIHGYSGTMINVADPWWGYSVVDFATFPARYHVGGNWTHTYWVKA